MVHSQFPYRYFPKPSSINDEMMIRIVSQQVFKGNQDNISRTKSYQHYYLIHKEIRWAFLASMVSRNAGWNMCDLYSSTFSAIVDQPLREKMLLTYERANWLIFRDAYPQLLLYHYSTILKRSWFHLLEKFSVSQFMIEEWEYFWKVKNEQRLMNALIINEQNIIQKPVINHPLYRRKVFFSPLFYLQELFHYSCVIFPTVGGELYGASVIQFRSLEKRIELGKKLAAILFHPDLYPYFIQFARNTEHTGSRYDYEQYFSFGKSRDTPFLRAAFPLIEHHISRMEDWSKGKKVNQIWLHSDDNSKHAAMTKWFLKKRQQIQLFGDIKQWLNNHH